MEDREEALLDNFQVRPILINRVFEAQMYDEETQEIIQARNQGKKRDFGIRETDAGGLKNVLVIGVDALSRIVDWTDRRTYHDLFGDVAGAVLIQACDGEDDGLLSFDMHSDGEGYRHLNAALKENETDDELGSNGSVLGFPPRQASYSCLQMNGKEVFHFAVRVMPQSIEYSLAKAGLPASSIDLLLLHQANQRILDAVSTRMQIPSKQVISNLANYGNTSASSISLALDEAVRSGMVKLGQTIAAAGFGAGLTWASTTFRWG
nr:3-oxoacyl-[acyl-carrier-protein] synthase III, chloroplastic-like [Malus domestica]